MCIENINYRNLLNNKRILYQQWWKIDFDYIFLMDFEE